MIRNIRQLTLVYGSVAQLAEQGIHKPRVTGSSPVAAISGFVELAYLSQSLDKYGRF